MTADTNTRHLDARIAAVVLLFAAGSACAQAQPSSLNLQLPQPPDGRPDVSQGAAASDDYDDSGAADAGTSVHGGFTTGIGYSKALGNSTVNAADLDVSKQYDNGKVLNLHIDVLRATGLPNGPPHDYVSRYPGY